RELHRLRETTGVVRKRVAVLTGQVAPVREREARLRVYSEKLRELAIQHEKQEQERADHEAGSRRRRIQRKKMGFDSGPAPG
ncbi:MAG: hypothetical protein AB1505_31950, partial [Candidatus Latescibacterota bacterium]